MHLPLALFLAAAPPVVPLPPALEVCVLQAELCTLEAGFPMCALPGAFDDCLEQWETCAWPFPDIHDEWPDCRTALARCRVEHCISGEEQLKACAEIYEACPDPVLADACPVPG